MHMPDVHSCSQLQQENEGLKKKLRRLRQQNTDMQRELNDLHDKQRMEAMKRQFVTTRNMETQTDPPKTLNTHRQPPKKDQPAENDRVNKLIAMHNGLMKRYERELKSNMQHMETITTLNLKVNELEQKVRESQLRAHQMELNKSRSGVGEDVNSRRRTCSASSADDTSEIHCLRRELEKTKKERDKLAHDKRRLKEELRGLDHGFFEEVEDLKYALQESIRLNQEYERSLRRLCSQFGLPYPQFDRRSAAGSGEGGSGGPD